MNIKKTNPIGISLIEDSLKVLKDAKSAVLNQVKSSILVNDQKADSLVDNNKGHMIRMSVFDFNKNQKVLRLTKNIIENCKLINIDSIKDNIDVKDFDFESITILLDNDESGMIKIDRQGSDFDFLYLKNLKNLDRVYFDTYSFLTKEFSFRNKCEDSFFVVRILAYLYYGDITTKVINPKSNVRLSSYSRFVNNSKFQITYVDSLWKQRISADGFKVRGHFRMQPFGEGRKKKKLIWVEEFSKDGYNRKATRELISKT